MPSFNLLDQPWIPILPRARPAVELVNLRELIAHAHEFAQIADASPLNTISLYRLVLALLHRALDGPASSSAWAALWDRGSFAMSVINPYLDRWHGRFDLFATQYPFYQTPGLSGLKTQKLGEIEGRAATELTFERASSRNKSLLFDHTLPNTFLEIAVAARALLSVQNFMAGGMITSESTATKFAKGGPLLGCAVCMLRGANLFETLLFNLPRYESGKDSVGIAYPFATRGPDLPAWERDAPTLPDERMPSGYTDLLTWQSRRVHLIPDEQPDGTIVIKSVLVMKGESFPQTFEVRGKEPMVAYRVRHIAKDNTPWLPIGLRADRLVWRDQQTLLRSRDQHQRVPMLDWIGVLMDTGHLDTQHPLPMEIFGAITDRANYLDWRHESLPLSTAILHHKDLVERIQEAVEFAEHVEMMLNPFRESPRADAYKSPMYVFCEELLRIKEGEDVRKETVTALANSFGIVQRYWADLDPRFHVFLAQVPGDVTEELDGSLTYGARVLAEWRTEVIKIGIACFDSVKARVGINGRALRATALAQSQFNYDVARLRQRQDTEERKHAINEPV